VHSGDMAGQIEASLNNLEDVLKEAGMTLVDVVRLNMYTTNIPLFLEHWGPIGMARLQAAGVAPAGILLGVVALADPHLMVELEATAVA
jgi:enamine deaminase RidA (YjgF/YER057c/UK114 family)